MKKVALFILTMLCCVLNTNAQEIPTSQTDSNKAIIDSLSFQLNKLQRDYDYLRCEFDLKDLKNEVEIFCNKINISSNAVLLHCYNSGFNYVLYSAYEDNYEASIKAFESLKNAISAAKAFVAMKMMVSDFSEEEINLLQQLFDHSDLQINSAEQALKYYKVVIDMYLQS